MTNRSVCSRGHDLVEGPSAWPLLLAASLSAGLVGCAAPEAANLDDEQALIAAPTKQVTLSWASVPTDPVAGTVKLSLRGENLVNVELFYDGERLVRAAVASDGKSAQAEVDTHSLPNGKVELTAHAWDSPAGADFTSEADAGVLTIIVQNEPSGTEADTDQPSTDPADTPSSSSDHHPDGYRLVFSDEFDGSQLDSSKWCTRYVFGGGSAPEVEDAECQKNGAGTLDFLNDEQQRYVETNRDGRKMHELKGGVLSLWATSTGYDDYAKYQSAMVRSKMLFLPDRSTSYYITARLRLPSVRGSWPAFWLNSDWKPDGTLSWPPEIDIIDAALNEKDDRVEMLHQAAIVSGRQTASGDSERTFIAPEYDPNVSNYNAETSQRDKWIEVGLAWHADSVCYFVDGYKTMCEKYRWVEDDGAAAAPAHVLLNLAIGGSWAGRYGVDDARFPIRLQADHVRVYKGAASQD